MRSWIWIGGCLVLLGCTKSPEVVAPPAPPTAVRTADASPRRIPLEVTDDGFKPDSIKLKANEPVRFVVTRTTDETCATDLVIDGTDIKVALPLNKAVEIAWTPTKAGTVKFGCAMDMMVSGVLLVE